MIIYPEMRMKISILIGKVNRFSLLIKNYVMIIRSGEKHRYDLVKKLITKSNKLALGGGLDDIQIQYSNHSTSGLQ